MDSRVVVLVAALLPGCLPEDGRPEPGSLQVSIEPSAGVRDGFATDDGWNIEFSEFLTALGEVELEVRDDSSDDCVEYSQSRYNRLFDFTVVERENLNRVFGLGQCSVRFEYGPPDTDTVLGPGASESDLTRMRTAGSDAYTTDAHAGLIVRGAATRDSEQVRFEWAFRMNVELEECGYLSDLTSIVQLTGGVSDEMTLVVAGEQLFRETPYDDAELRFQPFADADADGDGDVTLAELGEVDAPEDFDVDDLELELPSGVDTSDLSLADLVYLLQFTAIPRVAGGGRCKFEIEDFSGGVSF